MTAKLSLAAAATLAALRIGSYHEAQAFTFAPSPTFSTTRHPRGDSSVSSLSPPSYRTSATALAGANRDEEGSGIPRDVLIIGGGLAGLSIAHRIATTSSRHVTILDRETPDQQRGRNNGVGGGGSGGGNGGTVAGSFAAAGMLAPQSERLPAGPLLDLCLASRAMYSKFVRDVEDGARAASFGAKSSNRHHGGDTYTGEGAKYLWELNDENGVPPSFDGGASPPLEPWEVGFHASGGFLAPAFAGDAVATWSPQQSVDSGAALWLDEVQVRELEPLVDRGVVGGWWFPEDASVDARRLTCSLRAACVGAGVDLKMGEEFGVGSLEMSGNKCKGVRLASGKIYSPKSLVVANGSWMRQLLPVPIVPHKGQSLSLRMPPNAPPLLSRVLFAQDTYIVPKADGRIIIGATVEPGRYDGDVTPSGMMHCMAEASRLVPGLADLPIEESWAGLRPTTPDKGPILGGSGRWDNVYLAGGYWRNGVLLAPKTGQLIADQILNDGNDHDDDKESGLSDADTHLLKAFAWDRFTSPGGGAALAANARYAAQLYPVHKRSGGAGVSASVGTELGFYEGAAAAKDDRARDRAGLLDLGGGLVSSEGDEALERAAAMGTGDASAFHFGDAEDGWQVAKTNRGSVGREAVSEEPSIGAEQSTLTEAIPVAEPLPADDVEINGDSNSSNEMEGASIGADLSAVYERIKANKASATPKEMGEDTSEPLADPGFRISHVDSATGEATEVPPFMNPGTFFAMKEKQALEGALPSGPTCTDVVEPLPAVDGEEETSFDGYSTIRSAFGESSSGDETSRNMREARMRNRGKSSEIDETKIGAMQLVAPPAAVNGAVNGAQVNESASSEEDLSSVYERIRSNKASAQQNVVMGDAGPDTRPVLNFTIYHVDAETGEKRAIPPYTSPGEFFESIEKEKMANAEEGSNGEETANGMVDSSDDDNAWPLVNGSNNNGEASANQNYVNDGSDETTYDGYQDIEAANSSESREEELRRMKEARMENRAKASSKF